MSKVDTVRPASFEDATLAKLCWGGWQGGGNRGAPRVENMCEKRTEETGDRSVRTKENRENYEYRQRSDSEAWKESGGSVELEDCGVLGMGGSGCVMCTQRESVVRSDPNWFLVLRCSLMEV